jgi:hypothetical protein
VVNNNGGKKQSYDRSAGIEGEFYFISEYLSKVCLRLDLYRICSVLARISLYTLNVNTILFAYCTEKTLKLSRND